jgi:hypothetical protein
VYQAGALKLQPRSPNTAAGHHALRHEKMNETSRSSAFSGTATTGAPAVAKHPDVESGRAGTQGIEARPVSLTVNGQLCTLMIEPRITLRDALR